jgi:hypothetical protein
MKNTLKLLLGGRKSIKSARLMPMPTLKPKPHTPKHKHKSKTIESSAIQKNFKTFIDEYESQYANIEKVKKGLKSDEEIFKLLYLKNVI